MKIAFVTQFPYQLALEMNSNTEVAIQEFLSRATSCFLNRNFMFLFSMDTTCILKESLNM